MDDQNISEEEALTQVKDWFNSGNYDKASEGCKEILEVDPDNQDVKDLLSECEAKTGSGENTASPLTDTPTETIPTTETPTTEAPIETPMPENTFGATPEAVTETPTMDQPIAAPTPTVEATADTPPIEPTTDPIQTTESVPETTTPEIATDFTAPTPEVVTPTTETPISDTPIPGSDLSNGLNLDSTVETPMEPMSEVTTDTPEMASTSEETPIVPPDTPPEMPSMETEDSFSLGSDTNETTPEATPEINTPMPNNSPETTGKSKTIKIVSAILAIVLIGALSYFAYSTFFAGDDKTQEETTPEPTPEISEKATPEPTEESLPIITEKPETSGFIQPRDNPIAVSTVTNGTNPLIEGINEIVNELPLTSPPPVTAPDETKVKVNIDL